MSTTDKREQSAAFPVENRLPGNGLPDTTTVDGSTSLPGRVGTMPAVKTRRQGDLALALLYMAPALLIFTAFTFVPFFRSIYLSFFVTNAIGEPVTFNDVKYYSRILNLDGSGRDEYLKSILTTIQFTLLVVPLSLATSIGLAQLATARIKSIAFFRTIFTSSVSISVASAGVIWALIYAPATAVTQWLINILGIKTGSLLLDAGTALPAVAFMTVWTGLGFNFIITLSGIQAIPNDIYESGRIDGTSGWSAFRFLTLPLLTPTLMFLFIINTIQCFQAS